MKQQSQILVVEDHPVTRHGICGILTSEDGLEVCGEASSADEAVGLVASTQPDLVLCDIALDGRNGLELLKDIKSVSPDTPVLMMSMYPESAYAQRALKAGASGYVMKQELPETVVIAVRKVLAGGIFVSDRISAQIVATFSGKRSAVSDPVATLSDRELEVFERIGHGLGNKEIAEKMNLSPRTVESYRSRIKDKLDFPDGRTLVREAIRWVDSQQ